MSKFKFKEQKDIIIKWFKEGKQYVDIAKLLHSTNIENDAQNIRRLIHHELGNINSNRKIVITNDIKDKLNKLYHEGYKPKEMGNILNISSITISSYFRGIGVSFKPFKGNTNYFHHINSYAKAYILGFIAADGSLVKPKKGNDALTITVKYQDKAVLEFIKSEIGNSHIIKDIIRPSSYDKSKIIHHSRYCMTDASIANDLHKLGIDNNKSLTMGNIIENIPYKYRDAFIIGYFDGDGSVTVRDSLRNERGYICNDYSLYVSFRGTKAFLKGICNHLNISESHIKQYTSIATLSFANKKDTYRLFQCYKNLPFYYIRKHDKFLQRINHPSYDKYKQVQTISSLS